MSLNKKILMVSLSSLLLAASSHASDTPTQGKPDIRVNIQGDTHQDYKGETNSSGVQANDVSANSDRQILEQVKSLIGSTYGKYNINISVSEGIVILRGVVDNDTNMTHIEKDIRNIKGVKDVQNQLHVEGAKKS